jgi:2-isopropylmalate synthase
VKLGIHTHNDGGLAVANSLIAVEHGAVQVQGTINGIGERCGNVDLTTVVANLRLKLGLKCLAREDSLAHLTETSRFVYELANMNLVPGQPYVGPAAFAHKGGMHVHAVNRIAHSYEHVQPETVGNTRRVLVSELSGVSNITALLGRKFDIADDRDLQRRVLGKVQDLENAGYQFEAAAASFELLLYGEMGRRRPYWKLDHYRCVILKQDGAAPSTEAIVKLDVGGATEHHVAEGDGPVNALDGAMRKCLLPHYPQLREVHLRDYKVRVVNAAQESAAKVRVVIDFAVIEEGRPERYFSTIGVSENIVDASWGALIDAFEYHLLECGVLPGRG